MSFKSQFIKIPGSKYGDGLVLEQYNDRFSLIAAKDAEDGYFKRWCRPQVRKGEFAETAIPIQIQLGDLDESITILDDLLAALTVYQSETSKGGR